MRTSKNDKVDISTLMQSIDNTETLNTETDKIGKLMETTTQLNKCLLSVVEQLKNITSQPVELTIKQADIDQFRLVKNGYIQEETELLKKHVAEQLASNHLFYHNTLEPPLFKGDSRSIKNKILLILTFIS